MANYKWDMKSNYLLAFTVCKYGLNPEQWNLIANDLSDYINTTPQNCKIQFDMLCQEYGQNWQNQSVEPLHTHIFSIIKRLYYGDLCKRMTESRDLLMATYDFIRLFKGGRITSNDINEISQDVKNTAITGNNTYDNERQQKIKMLERLKLYMTTQTSETSDIQQSLFPVELLPPPPFFQQQQQQQPIITNNISSQQSILITNQNDREVPSMSEYQKTNITNITSFPMIIQSNNLINENGGQSLNKNQSNKIDIDEIELSSDDDIDRTTITNEHISNIDEPVTNSNLINDQDESTFISDEQMDTNESSNIPPIPVDISNSNDKDLYEHINSTTTSNQSTFDTRLSAEDRATSSNNDQPVSSNILLNSSVNGSNDYVTLDNDQIQSIEEHHQPIHIEPIVSTAVHIPIEDDEVARMDAEQIPEPIPADITDIAIPNDNAIFSVDETDSNIDTSQVSTTHTNEVQESLLEIHENDELINTRNSRRQSRLTTSSLSSNFRKSINSILTNLKNAKYGPDFAKPLKSFKLPDEYYFRIKKPIDIPEIRERMNNGDYDDNILLFERDILLMFTNALSMYSRDLDIHGHAQFMINYAMELLTPIDDILTPWIDNHNENDHDLSNVFRSDNGNDSDDNTINHSSSTRTPSIASTSSSIRTDLPSKNLRRQITSIHPMNKRQRKSTH